MLRLGYSDLITFCMRTLQHGLGLAMARAMAMALAMTMTMLMAMIILKGGWFESERTHVILKKTSSLTLVNKLQKVKVWPNLQRASEKALHPLHKCQVEHWHGARKNTKVRTSSC